MASNQATFPYNKGIAHNIGLNRVKLHQLSPITSPPALARVYKLIKNTDRKEIQDTEMSNQEERYKKKERSLEE